MESIIGLKELRQNVDKYAKKIQAGEEIIVVRRSKPLFKLTSPEKEWEEVIDFTKIKKGGVDIKEILSRL